MVNTPSEPNQSQPEMPRSREAANWAKPIQHLRVTDAPTGAMNINVNGRQTTSPLRGFGQLWQKTYQIRLQGAKVTPQEVIQVWKEKFPQFQPKENRFYPSIAGVKPGEIVLINAMTPGGPVSTGVMVMYADEESFTLMTPEGHPESGWVTFSAFVDEGECTIAHVQSLARANDPVYELAFRLMGASLQENIWRHVLTSLAGHFGVQESVKLDKICVDPKLQWSQAKNIVHNAQMHTLLYVITKPVRWLRRPTKTT